MHLFVAFSSCFRRFGVGPPPVANDDGFDGFDISMKNLRKPAGLSRLEAWHFPYSQPTMSGPNRAGRAWKSFHATFPQDVSAVGGGSKERRRESPPESAKRGRWISSNVQGHENYTDTQASAQSKLKSCLVSSSVNMQGQASLDSPWKRLENLQRPRDMGQVEVSADEECSRASKSKLRNEDQQIGTRALPHGISAIPAKRLIDAAKPMIKSRRQEAACTCPRPDIGDKVRLRKHAKKPSQVIYVYLYILPFTCSCNYSCLIAGTVYLYILPFTCSFIYSCLIAGTGSSMAVFQMCFIVTKDMRRVVKPIFVTSSFAKEQIAGFRIP